MRLKRSLVPTTDNPFLTPEEPELPPAEPLGIDEFLGLGISVKGPGAPAVPAGGLASSIVLPRRELTTKPLVCVAGVHGGAGTTTLAGLLGEGAFDAGVCWPVAGGWVRPLPVLPVVLVARTNGAGLDAADRVARAWGAGELGESRLLGLVLVDDAPHLTRTQRAAATRLSLMTPTGWHIAWQPQWREATPCAGDIPARIRKTLADIRRQAAPEEPSHS
jgi:hypothetical protein